MIPWIRSEADRSTDRARNASTLGGTEEFPVDVHRLGDPVGVDVDRVGRFELEPVRLELEVVEGPMTVPAGSSAVLRTPLGPRM